MSFAEATNQTKQKMKDTVMKMKNNLLGKISALQQSKWLMPALMALAIVVTILGVTGCGTPHH